MSFFRDKILRFKRERKTDIPSGLWEKCPACSEMITTEELALNWNVCPKCGHHFHLDRLRRVELFADANSFEEWDTGLYSVDTLGFTGTASYGSKIKENMSKTGFKDAITIGKARMKGREIGLGVMDFKFLGASMGAVVGEKVTRLIEKSTAAKMPVVLVCASGGARMYEGLFSLMQMAKTSGALARHAEAALPYVPVLTHPTTAGVMASFATLGDVIIAEPNALIGFAGPRVIKETTQQDLPEGFQRAEFLMKRGLIDIVAARSRLKDILSNMFDTMLGPVPPAPIRTTRRSIPDEDKTGASEEIHPLPESPVAPKNPTRRRSRKEETPPPPAAE